MPYVNKMQQILIRKRLIHGVLPPEHQISAQGIRIQITVIARLTAPNMIIAIVIKLRSNRAVMDPLFPIVTPRKVTPRKKKVKKVFSLVGLYLLRSF